MVEKYIVTKNKIIIGNFETSQGKKGIEKSMAGTVYDNIIKVDIDSDHRRETHIDEYEKDGKFKKLSERVNNGHLILPEDHKLDGEKIIPKTLEEKFNDGLLEISPFMKAVGNDLIEKTYAELVSTGVKTQSEIDEQKQIDADEKLIAEEMRKMAIANLGDELGAVKK